MRSKGLKKQYGFLSEENRVFPPMVVVKITNTCNSACVHCPYSFISKREDYEPTHMEWGLYKKIVDEVAAHKRVLFRLLCDGEPLMHPRFLDMLAYAKSKRIAPLNFITNGTRLNQEIAEKVLDLGVEVVEVSLDALTRATYEKIRVGCDFDLVMSNLQRLIDMRDRKKASTRIFVSIIDQKESESELTAFVEYWSQRVDRVLVRPFTTIGGTLSERKLKLVLEGDRWPCPLLWQRFFINCRGGAEFCVEDWYSETVVGDVNKSSIQEIWSSEGYERIRQAHLSGKFDEVPYCGKCRDWKAREWGNDYFKAIAIAFHGRE